MDVRCETETQVSYAWDSGSKPWTCRTKLKPKFHTHETVIPNHRRALRNWKPSSNRCRLFVHIMYLYVSASVKLLLYISNVFNVFLSLHKKMLTVENASENKRKTENNFLTPLPAQCGSREVAPSSMSGDVILCCLLIRGIAYLRGCWYMDME
jgi:hypothetical protein